MTSSLREKFKLARAQLTLEQQTEYSERILQTLIAQPYFQSAQTIACYISLRNEVQTEKIIAAIFAAGKFCYLPCLAGTHLEFALYQSGDKLEQSSVKSWELSLKQGKCDAQDLDLILTPLLAFDKHCHRLGLGGGYYDRSLAFLNIENRPEKPLAVGLAYQVQKASKLEKKSWDVDLDQVITEQAIFNRP